MPAVINDQALSFDALASGATNWFQNIFGTSANYVSAVRTPQKMVFQGTANSQFSGWFVTVLPVTGFIGTGGTGLGFTGNVASIQLSKPTGEVVSTITDLFTGVNFSSYLLTNGGSTYWNFYTDFLGSGGAEIFTGGAGGDIVDGGAGDDVLNGAGGNDLMAGGLGADKLDGGAGDDILVVGTGDTVIGGAGADLIGAEAGFTGPLDVDGGTGVDTLDLFDAGAPLTILFGAAATAGAVTVREVETVYGSDFGDTVTGSALGETFLGGEGADVVRMGDGADTVQGWGGNDQLFGDAGDDVLGGGVGFNKLDGGAGTDIADYTTAIDKVFVDLAFTLSQDTGLGFDTFTSIEGVRAGDYGSELYGDAGANTLAGGAGLDRLSGREGDDTLTGGAGNDILSGGLGADRLDGGAGIDTVTYADADAGVTVVLSQTAAQNTGGAGTDTLAAIEAVIGSAFNDDISGDAAANTLTGGQGHDILRGAAGTDTLIGGDGNDWLMGQDGNDTLDGGLGVDTYDGGLGYDVVSYLSATSGVRIDLLTPGNNTGDAVLETFTGVEGFYLTHFADAATGGASADEFHGGDGDDALSGGQGGDYLYGEYGDDTVQGGEGDDTLLGGFGNDVLDGGAGVDTATFTDATSRITVDLTIAGAQDTGQGLDTFSGVENVFGGNFGAGLYGDAAANSLYGGAAQDVLIGRDGADRLTGGLGDDVLWGGAGDDYLLGDFGFDTAVYFDAAAAVVIDLRNFNKLSAVPMNTGGGGVDYLANIEGLAGGDFDDQLTGDTNNNNLTGGRGNDILSGDAGADLLVGGEGLDWLIGGSGDDQLDGGAGVDTLDGGVGFDTVSYASATAAVGLNLGAPYRGFGDALGDTLTGVERVVFSGFGDLGVGAASADEFYGGAGDDLLMGQGADDKLYGELGGDRLEGGDGNDTLIGGAGADTMLGGLGDDVFEITEVSDSVIEAAGEGVDTAVSLVEGWVLADNVENLAMGGSTVNGAGNAGDNGIFGNAANNMLAGGAGNDLMIGGLGDDTYEVTEAGDIVRETAGQGADTVVAYIDNYGLTANVENLVLAGAALVGFGNAQANAMFGNAANNTLVGGGGNDIMAGGLGDDTYVVTESLDQVRENAGEGVDTVFASVDYALSADVENLVLVDNAGSGFGNAGANLLVGNALGNNLAGGGGDDLLVGNGGADTFFWTGTSAGRDTINDFVVGTDKVLLSSSMFAGFSDVQGHAAQVGADTVITFDANTSLTLKGVGLASLTANEFTFSATEDGGGQPTASLHQTVKDGAVPAAADQAMDLTLWSTPARHDAHAHAHGFAANWLF